MAGAWGGPPPTPLPLRRQSRRPKTLPSPQKLEPWTREARVNMCVLQYELSG